MKRYWLFITGFILFSMAAGAVVLKPHPKKADSCCAQKSGEPTAAHSKDCPMHAEASKELPPGHPEIGQLPPGHPDISMMQAKPLTDEQLKTGGNDNCPFLSKQQKSPTQKS